MPKQFYPVELAVSHRLAAALWEADNKGKEKENERSNVMQPMGKLIIPLAIAFALLFALNLSGFDQATVPTPGTATNPSTGQPAQNPGQTPIQPGIGTTTPNNIPGQPPNTTTPNSTVILTPNPNFTPNSNVIPNSTSPNQNPNLVPNPYPNTVPTVPNPNSNSNVNAGATNPNVMLGTQPNNSSGTPAPSGSGPAIGAGVPGASQPGCFNLQAWQCIGGL
jgi:hypothetical protein